MVYRDLFGRDLTEYELEILTNNGVAEEQWARAVEQMEIARAFRDTRGTRAKLRKILKAAGIAAGALGPLIRTFTKPWTSPVGNEKRGTPDTADERSPKRLRSQPNSLRNAQALANMSKKDNDVEMEAVQPNQLARASVQTQANIGRAGAQETPIYKQVPHYGMPNTTTVVLPWTNYLSVITPPNASSTNVGVKYRMNSVYDIFPQSTNSAVGGAAITEGRYTSKYTGQSTWPATLVNFPIQPTPGANYTTEAPQWRGVWDKFYTYYTVLGCHYKITVHNPRRVIGKDVTIAKGFDSFSVANPGINYPEGRPIHEMEYWPGLSWHRAKSYANGEDDENYTVIEGYWKPGMVERNVQNDEDVKTWTKVNETPLLTEQMRLFFTNGEFNVDSVECGIAMKIQLEYIVQFKDLNVNTMYPAQNQTAFAVNIPTDIIKLQ